MGPTQSEDFPTGTLTFLLTDVEGSSRAWEDDPSAAADAMRSLGELLDRTIAKHRGVRPIEQGEGDSALAAFERASEAVACALDIQLALRGDVRLRIGLHTGEAQLRDGTYFGPTVNRCARIRTAAHGGQTLLSGVTAELVQDVLPDGATLHDLGSHRLRDLSRPERAWQLCHADLPTDFPPLRTAAARAGNLPQTVTTFVGREKELTQLSALLDKTRLLTLIGAGGCGKTRLSLQLGVDHRDDFEDGVWWVDLAPLSDPALLAATVAAALAVRDEPGREPLQRLTDHLAGKDALVIFDNCEHLIDAAAHLTDTLLRTCPTVTILATSREPLGIDGETSWRVPSLSLPTAADQDVVSVSTSEAVRLFCDRAALHRPGFVLAPEIAPSVAQICIRLDGIPLAIELAAARVRALSPAQIADGLADRFRLLTGGSRTSLPRQRTLEASVDWSYNMLAADEQMLLRRLSVFAGGFTLEYAEAVCSDDTLDRHRVLDVLSRLVDRSLVQSDDDGDRFGILETIRDYARRKLADAGEAAHVRDRHLTLYVELCERFETVFETNRQEAVHWLTPTRDNVRAAVGWAIESAHVDEALRLLIMWPHTWRTGDTIDEGRAHLNAALALDGGDPVLRGRAMAMLSLLTGLQFDYGGSRVPAEQALELGLETGDAWTIGFACGLMAQYHLGNDNAAARSFAIEGIEALRACNEVLGELIALGILGQIEIQDADFAAVRSVGERGLELAKAAGFNGHATGFLYLLGSGDVLGGEFDRAERLIRDAVRLGDDTGFSHEVVLARAFLGRLLMYRGEYAAAHRVFDEASEIIRDTKVPSGVHVAIAEALLSFAEGNLDEARQRFEVLLALARTVDRWFYTVGTLADAADTLLCIGEIDQATKLIDEAMRFEQKIYLPLETPRVTIVAARLARHVGEIDRAQELSHEAIEAIAALSAKPVLLEVLELLGGIMADAGAHAEAARVLGAAQAARDSVGYVRLAVRRPEFEADVAAVRDALGDAFEQSWDEGARLTLDEVVSYVTRMRGKRGRPSAGWASLTPTELEVTKLVAEGLTNPQIAERLFVAPGTVKTHLSHVFAKLSLSSRAELASEATRRSADA
jgi:predicted ATPase/class 3 adenylate cyclase/DNA-binding CsgD family transcriptional regulator/tetratricopeptide (TPR) repeat protein